MTQFMTGPRGQKLAFSKIDGAGPTVVFLGFFWKTGPRRGGRPFFDLITQHMANPRARSPNTASRNGPKTPPPSLRPKPVET